MNVCSRVSVAIAVRNLKVLRDISMRFAIKRFAARRRRRTGESIFICGCRRRFEICSCVEERDTTWHKVMRSLSPSAATSSSGKVV